MRFLLAALCCALFFVTSSCGAPDGIAKAKAQCMNSGSAGIISFGDDDHTLIAEGVDSGAMVYVDCAMDRIGTSDALRTSVEDTSATMGRQSRDEDGYHYEWSFFPGDGLSMTITTK